MYGDAPTSAWVMLHKGANKWAQVGWWKHASGLREVFVQYIDNNGNWPTPTFPAQPIGSLHNYRVQRVFDDSFWRFKFYRDSTLLTTATNLNWVQDEYAVRGETHLPRNQMPGGYNSRMHFYSTYYYVGSSLYEVNSPPSAYDPWHGAYKYPGGVHYEIWDDACAT